MRAALNASNTSSRTRSPAPRISEGGATGAGAVSANGPISLRRAFLTIKGRAAELTIAGERATPPKNGKQIQVKNGVAAEVKSFVR